MDNKKFLRYEDASWNVSALFVHDAAVLFFYDLLKECGTELNMTVHGNIPCRWNSGRIVKSVSDDYQKWCLMEYAKRDIPVLLTFSNYFISENELDDKPSNSILKLISEVPGNGVIIASPVLKKYITEKYPGLFMSSSILKAVNEKGQGSAAYYNALSEQFDRVVLHPDDGFDLELFKNLEHKEKIEILLNENCVRKCMFRKEHCDIVSEYYQQRRPMECFEKLNSFKKQKCKSVQDITSLVQFVQGKKQTCNMSYEELEKAYEAGCRCFKLQGRSLSTASIMYDLTRYVICEEKSGIIYKMIMDRIGSKSLEENRNLLNIESVKWERV